MKKFLSFFIISIFLFLTIYIFKNAFPVKTEHDYQDKYISILGDSISTFDSWIPEGNRVYYYGTNCHVQTIDDTWWKKVINAFDMQLCVNNSWSGSRVTSTAGVLSAGSVLRCMRLHREEIMPDVIIVYMGINDFNNNVALGSYRDSYKDLSIYEAATDTFYEAYAVMLYRLTHTYPDSEIHVCTLPYSNATGTGQKEVPTNQNGVPLTDFNDAIRRLADLFDVHVIDFANCGITSENFNLYLGDYNQKTKYGLHPNKYGHSLLANTVLQTLVPDHDISYNSEPLP